MHVVLGSILAMCLALPWWGRLSRLGSGSDPTAADNALREWFPSLAQGGRASVPAR